MTSLSRIQRLVGLVDVTRNFGTTTTFDVFYFCGHSDIFAKPSTVQA